MTVSDSIREAQRRLREIGVPVDPDARWTDIDYSGDVEAQVRARTDATTDYLYNVITYGRRVLAARTNNDWDAYTQALRTMLGQEMSANIPRITRTVLRDRNRKNAQKPRSQAKACARELFAQASPQTAKDLGRLVRAARPDSDLSDAAIESWFTEFRRKKNPK